MWFHSNHHLFFKNCAYNEKKTSCTSTPNCENADKTKAYANSDSML